MGFNFFYLRQFWTLCIWICVGYICPLQCGLGLKLQGADLKIIIISIVANCGSQTIVAGGAWTHSPRITRKVSWPLAQRGPLFLVNPVVIEARLEDLVKRGLWLEGQAGRAEVWLAGDMLIAQLRRELLQLGPGVICTSRRGHQCCKSWFARPEWCAISSKSGSHRGVT